MRGLLKNDRSAPTDEEVAAVIKLPTNPSS
jgi:hypothetical protein